MARHPQTTIRTALETTPRPAPAHPTTEARDAGQEFIDWVLGYGYAAGHWSERPVGHEETSPRRILARK